MFFKETFQFLSERYREDNIVYAYVHMDEPRLTCIQAEAAHEKTDQDSLLP